MNTLGFYEKRRSGRMLSSMVAMWLWAQPGVSFIYNREDDPVWQSQGVDYEVLYHGGERVKLEVKADSYKSGNFWLETHQAGKDGCFVSSKADVWAYWFHKSDVAYWLPLDEVREYVMGHRGDFVISKVCSKMGSAYYTSEGLLVPILSILDNCPGVQVHEGLLSQTIGVMKASV